MARYIVKRVLAALITIWFIMTITFVLMNAIPGSPLDSEKFLDVTLKQAMLAKYGLDRPLYERYLKYLADYLHGDFGISYIKVGLSTNEIIAAGFPYSLRIGIYSSVLIIIFGIAAGILAALRQNKFVDRFVFATLYLFLFSKILGLVPAFGVANWKGYIGPVLVTSVFSMAFVTRLMRTSMIEELNQDYIRTARAKGISEFKVVTRHALRNAVLPVVTYIGPMVAMVVTGSFVIEKVFGIPGIGSLFTTSILSRDYTLIMGITVFFAVFLVVCTLIVDILYVFVDPRIKYD